MVIVQTVSTPNERLENMTSTTTSSSTTLLRPKKRKVPYPNTILDTSHLIYELEKRNLYGTKILPIHIIAFYQALHRQHYPTLPDFVTNYYNNEYKAQKQQNHKVTTNIDSTNETNNHRSDIDESIATPTSATNTETTLQQQQPLKNRISNKKNNNRMQLPKVLLDFLYTTNDFVTITSTIIQIKTSFDSSTTKIIIQLHDQQIIESVIMRYNQPNKQNIKSKTGYGNGRASLCVSSQCGCAMGCTFCATGTMGLTGNLTMGEILEQIIHADRILANEWNIKKIQLQQQNNRNVLTLPKLDLIRNVVFMGMGEPLDNYDNVVAACRALTDNRRWNIAHSRVTVSTVGIVDKIRQLTKDLPEVNLAVSLHAPNQYMRTSIVPSAKRYPIQELIDALDNHMMTFASKKEQQRHVRTNYENPQNGECDDESTSGIGTTKDQFTIEERIKESTRRRAMIEYVMLEGATSSIEAAHELGKLCEGRQLVVNLIPYNQTDVKDQLRCPSEDHMQLFRNIVASYGSFCTIRRTMGADIDSACGQLVTLENNKRIKQNKMKQQQQSISMDIEDVLLPSISSKPVVTIQSNHTKNENMNDMKETTKAIKLYDENSNGDNSINNNSDSCSVMNLDVWIHTLSMATIISATCFLISTCMFVHQQQQHRKR